MDNGRLPSPTDDDGRPRTADWNGSCVSAFPVSHQHHSITNAQSAGRNWRPRLQKTALQEQAPRRAVLLFPKLACPTPPTPGFQAGRACLPRGRMEQPLAFPVQISAKVVRWNFIPMVDAAPGGQCHRQASPGTPWEPHSCASTAKTSFMTLNARQQTLNNSLKKQSFGFPLP